MESITMRASILICALFCATAQAEEPDAATTATAKAFVEYGLKDPTSVIYRNLAAYSDGVICGEYNAKNGYGGYTGFSWFIYSKAQYRFMSTEATPSDVRVLCSSPGSRKFALHALLPAIKEITDMEFDCRAQRSRGGAQPACEAGHALVAQYKATYPDTYSPKFAP